MCFQRAESKRFLLHLDVLNLPAAGGGVLSPILRAFGGRGRTMASVTARWRCHTALEDIVAILIVINVLKTGYGPIKTTGGHCWTRKFFPLWAAGGSNPRLP